MTSDTVAKSMRSLRFHRYGEPADVLGLEEAAIPKPRSDTVCVRVHACALNPADWALCRGLFARDLPRGIGLDVSGTVSAVGDGVIGVGIGDPVFGPADFVNFPSAGASDFAVLSHWAAVPAGLDLLQAAALPMVVETAHRYIDWTGVKAGQTILIHGAGSMVGFAAVQMALMRGALVVATAGDTFAERLRTLGANVTGYGDGLVERVRALVKTPPDFIVDSAPVNLNPGLAAHSALPDLIKIAGNDPERVITIADFENAKATGARTGMEDAASMESMKLHYHALSEFAQYAAEGRFNVPIARTYELEEWRDALDLSVSGRARGKLVFCFWRSADGRSRNYWDDAASSEFEARPHSSAGKILCNPRGGVS